MFSQNLKKNGENFSSLFKIVFKNSYGGIKFSSLKTFKKKVILKKWLSIIRGVE
jgi:hypothetical protein